MTLAPTVYTLGAITTFVCTVLLLSAYRRVRTRLLLWSGLCFAGLTVSNVLVFVDLVSFPEIDLFTLRLATTAVALGFLLYGLIWDTP